jgi:hypothetical protein
MDTQRRRRGQVRGGEGVRPAGNIWKGLASGIIGGLAAAAVMNTFQALLSRQAGAEERSHGAQSLQQGSPRQGVGLELRAEGRDDESDDATERLANAVSLKVLHRELTPREKEVAGTAFHYAMGATSGALYGAVAEIAPGATTGAGLPFGAAVWLVADEAIVPAAGLSKSPSEYPLSIHAYSFASHLVFGLTAEVVRRAARKALR